MITSIAKHAFHARQKALEKHLNQGKELQEKVLQHLLHRAENTFYGTQHKFRDIHSYEDFKKNVPVNTYEDVKDCIDRMRQV